MYQNHETKPDKNGIKYVTEYKQTNDGKIVKTTKKVQVTTIFKRKNEGAQRAQERQLRWKKFGKAATSDNTGTTLQDGPISSFLRETDKRKEEKLNEKKQLDAQFNSLVAGVDTGSSVWKPSWAKKGESAPSNTYVPPHKAKPVEDSTAYIPPHKKTNVQSVSDEILTIRVTNLSEETTERDLENMFLKFGRITRINLVKDRFTNASRGFAFLTFTDKKNAQRAIDEMDRQGWDNSILKIEWTDK